MRLADFIETNRTEIAQEWETFARSREPATSTVSTLVLRDHIEEILTAVANDMRLPQSSAEQDAKAKGGGPPGGLDVAGQGHAAQRVDLGASLDQAVSEFRALRASIVRLWLETSPAPTESNRSDLIRFNEAIDQILIESMNAHDRRLERYRKQSLAILGHDLRNPLGAIMTSAAAMSRAKDLGERYSKAAGLILSSARRMSRMMNDLLDLTRSQLGGGLPLAPTAVDLEAVCRQVLEELETSHPDRALRFEPGGDLHGEWDRDRLAQVVSNLIANALQHGDPGAPIALSARPDGDRVALAVHNQGPPIRPEDLGRIFEPLVHAETPDHARPSGSLGLGLFIVREIVTAHGGDIAVTSSEAQGTTFTVRLPRARP